MRAGAGEGVDQVVADATVAARIREAVVDVELAVGALESGRAGARVGSNQILARGAILTRRRVAFVDLMLAVTSRVTWIQSTTTTTSQEDPVSRILPE